MNIAKYRNSKSIHEICEAKTNKFYSASYPPRKSVEIPTCIKNVTYLFHFIALDNVIKNVCYVIK